MKSRAISCVLGSPCVMPRNCAWSEPNIATECDKHTTGNKHGRRIGNQCCSQYSFLVEGLDWNQIM